jgi:rRNA processing protein Gar1
LPSSINHYKENETIIIQENSNKTKEEIIDNINEVMKDYDIGKVYEIFGDEYNIKISPINTNSYKNISTYIDFSNCENILRTSNKLSNSSILTVYQLEIDNKNEQN